MKIPILLLLASLSLFCAESTQESDLLNITIQSQYPKGDTRRKSVIYAEIVQDLQAELHRTKSEHQEKERVSKCRVVTAFFTATASAAAGIVSVIYAISSCTNK